MKQLIATLCLLTVFQSYAWIGTASTPSESLYQQAIGYYELGQYNQARDKFEQYLRVGTNQNNLGNAAYYRAMSALKLYHQDGEYLMESYLEKYPFHSKAGLAYYEIGSYFYQNGKYKQAVTYFKKAKATVQLEDDLAFKFGYSYFNLKLMPEAAEQFAKVDQPDSEYYYAAHYYLGYIQFKQQKYEQSLESLTIASNSSDYIGSSALMIATIHLQNGKYRACINFCKKAQKEGYAIDPKLYFVMGNAQLKLQLFPDAITSFEQGLAASNNKAEPEVYFNIGEAYRMSGNVSKATEYYSLSALDKADVGHYSSYYLGKLYLEQENLEFAKTAFWQALKSEQLDIREEATFQLVKVSFKLGEYKECIEGAKQYQINFPKGQYTVQVNELLTEAFLNTSDYDLAIRYIESLEQLSPSIKNTYQKVTFQKASDQFNNRLFRNAIYYFDKSLKYKENRLLNIKAHYWKGEAFSIGKKYTDAINAYKSALYINDNAQESHYIKQLCRYGLGYAYFNAKDYENAKANFNSFLNSDLDHPTLKADAKIRVGDCHYVVKNYEKAITTYQSLLGNQDAALDYVNFQLGVVYSLNEQPEPAKTHYNKLINNFSNSSYRDNGIFQLAELNFESGIYETAVVGFSQLITEYPESQLVPHALLKRAVAQYNLGKYQEAESDYKAVLNDYLTHKTANGALLGLQQLYAVTGNDTDFNDFLERYKAANPNDESLESIEFEAAKSLYYSGRYEAANESLKNFRLKYTSSSFNNEVSYLIAECHFKKDQFADAIAELKEVTSDKSGKYLTRALYRLGSLLQENNQHQEALSVFRELGTYARTSRDQGNSWVGQMQAFYELQQMDSAISYAEKIMESRKLNQDTRAKAVLLIGDIYKQQKRYNLAIDQYLQLINDIKDENGAQAHYNLARVYYLQGKYKQSIETCFELNKQYAGYDTWLGRSFILIAENYIAMDELFQAKATLTSVVEKSKVEEIVLAARKKLLEIEKLEKKVLDDGTVVDSLNTNQGEHEQ